MQMVTYDYTDLDTGDPAASPEEGTYSVVALDHEHLVRYVMTTSQGAIVLRHLPLRMARLIEGVRRAVYPGIEELEARYEEIRRRMEGRPSEDFADEEVADLLRLDRELAMTDMTALGIVVEPRLASMDDYEQLYERLTEDERLRLVTAVKLLASVRDPRTVDPTAEAIARSAGVQLMDEDMLRMLTVSQAAYHLGRIQREAKAIDRMSGRVKVRP